MTVRELIKLLQTFDGDDVVVRADNSGGREDIYDVEMDHVVENNKEGRDLTVVVLQ